MRSSTGNTLNSNFLKRLNLCFPIILQELTSLIVLLVCIFDCISTFLNNISNSCCIFHSFAIFESYCAAFRIKFGFGWLSDRTLDLSNKFATSVWIVLSRLNKEI